MKKFYFLPVVFFSALSAFCQQPMASDPLLKKGNVYGGLSFNFSVNNTENQDQLIIFVEDRQNDIFNINVNSGYFIKDRFALGGSLTYGSRKRIGNEINIQGIPVQVSLKEEEWGIYGTMKNYLPLDANRHFYLYNLVLLGTTFSNELSETIAQDVLTRRYTKDKLVELRFVPGVMVNVVKGFAVEVGADVAGIRSSWSETEINGEPTTKKSSVSADLTINLLRLSLGFYYYFGFKHK